MRKFFVGVMAVTAILAAGVLAAAPLKLTPANPQPSRVKPGLTVQYAYPSDVKTLRDAANALAKGAEAGPNLKGLDYRDTGIGENTLTSKRPEKVVADIRGYVKFDAPGIYNIDFLTNDGVRATVGGQVVGKFDGRQTCQETFQTTVEVPKAGWYPVHVLYFQRLGTSCLHMRRGLKGGKLTWMSNKSFGH